jgi:hypothetical protein
MAVTKEQSGETGRDERPAVGGKAALTAAAAAAVTGAAAFGIRKALSRGGDGSSPGVRGGSGEDGRGPASILADAVSSTWESASRALLPIAEEAAAAAGRYVADHSPDVVRDRIVPRFIDAFNDAT